MGGFYGLFEIFSLFILCYTVESCFNLFLGTEKRTRDDIESTYASLRATLKTLQVRTVDYFGI